MKDQYLPALATVPAAWLLVYVPHFVKFGLMLRQRKSEYNNVTPRSEDPDAYGEAAGVIKRAIACHMNGFESFSAFVAAVVLCKIQKAKPMKVAALCFKYLLWRALFTAFYLAGGNRPTAALRSLSWFGSTHAIASLFREAL